MKIVLTHNGPIRCRR